MTSSSAIRRTLVGLALAAVLGGCNEARNPGYQGWVEADMIFVSPDESGRVTKLNAREGDEVNAGTQLYAVDDDLQQANLNQTKATLANAQQSYDRAFSLSKTGSGTQATLDAAVSALRVAEAQLVTSQTRLQRRIGYAPVTGTVQQIYFREGETVPAQRPVLSIMPPGNMKVRFYVPETDLPKLAIGDEVRVTCDNCSADLTARIYFIATTAEYTPPVIYSLDERNKLVYLVQARPSRPDALRVGPPLSGFLNPTPPVAAKRGAPTPQLLLLDEPTAGVDPKARRDFWNEIHGLAANGLTVLVSTHYMDEAERCHEIAYIPYGNLLTHGQGEEVIAKSALSTYTVTGDNLHVLQDKLAGKPGIDMVAPFGNSLHVSGRERAVLEATIAPWRDDAGVTWQQTQT